jgi:NMD protein affecting ribosome stability and mRNA decay
MGINKTHSGFHPISHDRPGFEEYIDAYKMKGKLSEPTVCPQCEAIFHKGRWQWGDVPANAHRETCPACHRLNDDFPAGFVTLEGPFYAEHSDEILRAVHNHEQHERAEHALKRIMAIKKQEGDSVLITTTDIHLARGIGKAIHDAYQGELALHYNAGENQLRAYWKR